MRYTVTTAATDTILTFSQLQYALRLDPGVASGTSETTYVADLLAGAVEYAQTALDSSLGQQTITAQFWQADRYIVLPRGPVQSITSVTDVNGQVPNYQWQTTGSVDFLSVTSGWAEPLTVVYVAGYPTGQVPADIRAAIRMHVGTLYDNRNTISDKPMTEVPNSLKDFYQLKRRTSLIG